MAEPQDTAVNPADYGDGTYDVPGYGQVINGQWAADYYAEHEGEPVYAPVADPAVVSLVEAPDAPPAADPAPVDGSVPADSVPSTEA